MHDDDFPGDDYQPQAAATKRDLIEGNLDKIADRDLSRAVAISGQNRSLQFANMLDLMQFAKLMATGDLALPKFLRGNPGACLAVAMQANEWAMSPFQVANKAYATNDRIAYESQLIHAVISTRAPLKKKLRCEYVGGGDDRKVIISGELKGEDAPFTYESPTVGAIKKRLGTNDRGQIKGSPLWVSDPDQQLWYFGTRAWARKWVPEVIMGIYAVDDFPDERADESLTVGAAGLQARLAGRPAEIVEEGFRPDSPADTIAALAEAGHKPAAQVEVTTKVEVAPAATEAPKEAIEPSPDKGEGEKPKRTRKPRAEKPAETAKDEPTEGVDAFSEEEATKTIPTAENEPASQPEAEAPTPEEWARIGEEQSAAIKTVDDYVAYAKAWMPAAPTHDHRNARWKGEKGARERLGVMGDALAELITLGKSFRPK